MVEATSRDALHSGLRSVRGVAELWAKLVEAGLADKCGDAFAQDNPARIVPMMINAGVRPDKVADLLSEALGVPRADSSEIASAQLAAREWFVSGNGIAYLVNPLDRRLKGEVSRVASARGGVRGWGVATQEDVASVASGVSRIVGAAQASSEEAERRLAEIMNAAVASRCSDVHIMPSGHEVLVRYRIDGDLKTVDVMNLDEHYEALANTLLGLAAKNAGEFIAPVSARFKWDTGAKELDVRMEMIPARASGRIAPRFVMRLLGGDASLVDFDAIGLPDDSTNPQRQTLLALAEKPHGMILVTGPTGSGKTTTLTALLRAVHGRRPQISISTLEDPVEIEIPGIAQTEINERAGMTFASGLRSLLRLDPDVILVGEIRDRETLDLGIRASLTGHLLLSTLHTNSAIGAIPRMIDMGADVALLADSLLGVLAQRVVKKLCPQCSIETELSALIEGRFPDGCPVTDRMRQRYAEYLLRYGEMRHAPGPGDVVRVPGPGCERCKNTGHSGRTIVSELVVIDQALKEMISERQPLSAYQKYLATPEQGFAPMWEHGMALFKRGVVSLDTLEERLGARPNYGRRFAYAREVRQI